MEDMENSSLNSQENQNYDNTSLPETNVFTDINQEISAAGTLNNLNQNSNTMNENEHFNCNMDQSRHFHIPYILNGELYQIQTQEGENVTVKCCNCPSDRVYRGSVRSTGNFHMHIKRRHPDLLGKLHNMKVNALLERRDRLMRNKKFSNHRSHRNLATSAPVRVFKTEPISQNQADIQLMPEVGRINSSPELSLMHTHKLKIKTVFRRHQLESNEMRQEIPNNECCEEVPLDYSFKTGNQNVIPEEQQQNSTQLLSTSAQNYTELATMQQSVNGDNTNSYQNANESTISPAVSYVNASYNFVNGTGTANERNYHNLSNVKPEDFSTAEEAINGATLTQTTSTESFNSIQGDARMHGPDPRTDNRDSNYWSDVILRIEKYLELIQSEMNVRNQIETDRMYLEIAKFKYLHPNFHYNW
uniref:Protein stand still n=1 Tax=Glossina austeni TaxID=7395 RepID=A0A1A9V4S6_GLOAU